MATAVQYQPKLVLAYEMESHATSSTSTQRSSVDLPLSPPTTTSISPRPTHTHTSSHKTRKNKRRSSDGDDEPSQAPRQRTPSTVTPPVVPPPVMVPNKRLHKRRTTDKHAIKETAEETPAPALAPSNATPAATTVAPLPPQSSSDKLVSKEDRASATSSPAATPAVFGESRKKSSKVALRKENSREDKHDGADASHASTQGQSREQIATPVSSATEQGPPSAGEDFPEPEDKQSNSPEPERKRRTKRKTSRKHSGNDKIDQHSLEGGAESEDEDRHLLLDAGTGNNETSDSLDSSIAVEGEYASMRVTMAQALLSATSKKHQSPALQRALAQSHTTPKEPTPPRMSVKPRTALVYESDASTTEMLSATPTPPPAKLTGSFKPIGEEVHEVEHPGVEQKGQDSDDEDLKGLFPSAAAAAASAAFNLSSASRDGSPRSTLRHAVLQSGIGMDARRRSREHHKSMSDDTMQASSMQYEDPRVRLNVGGRIFETFASTLRKYPNTLLGTMFHPRNAKMLRKKEMPAGVSAGVADRYEELFFDRNPRVFEVILDFYRTGTINRPPEVTLEMLKEELAFFQIELPEHGILNKRISMELIKLEYKNILLPAAEYRKMMRVKLLSEHLHTIVRVLEYMQRKIERKARSGHNTCTITFYSPLHYTNSTPREIFKVMSTNEIREILVELLKGKDFQVTETNEYSKTKATSIVGLQDQVVNYNDPKYFAFQIKW